MNKTGLFKLLVLTLILTACSSNASSAAGPAASGQGGGATGQLSAPMQVALGTIKLDGTENAVTPEQAKELLPLWETLQQLEGSDTAAIQEKEALVSQIQETMTQKQTQAISALNLSRQDMFSIMQSQVQTVGGTQNGTTQRNGSSTNSRRNSAGGPGGFFVAGGGPPPDGGGGFAGGNSNFQGQRSQSGSTTGSSIQPAAIDPNRVPTPLIQAVIEYLKTKASA